MTLCGVCQKPVEGNPVVLFTPTGRMRVFHPACYEHRIEGIHAAAKKERRPLNTRKP